MAPALPCFWAYKFCAMTLVIFKRCGSLVGLRGSRAVFLAHAESVSCVSQSLPLPAVQARGTMGRLMARWAVRAFLRPAAPPIPLPQEISE